MEAFLFCVGFCGGTSFRLYRFSIASAAKKGKAGTKYRWAVPAFCGILKAEARAFPNGSRKLHQISQFFG
jgi:hypothetical protein